MHTVNRTLGTVSNALRGRGLLSNIAALGSGAVAAQLISAVGTIWTARLFAPEAFGLLALFTAASLFFLPIVSGRYENAVMLPESDSEAAAIAGVSCGIALVSSVGFSAGALLFSERAATVLGLQSQHLPLLAVGASLNLLVWAVNQVAGYWCTRMKLFRHMAASRVLGAVSTTCVQLALYWSGVHSGIALILGAIIGQVAATSQLVYIGVRGRDVRTFWRGSWESKRRLLVEHRKFPLYSAPYSFVGGAGRQLTTVILQTFGGLHVVGLFFVAMRTVYLPVSLIAGSIRPAFYQLCCSTETTTESTSRTANRIIRSLTTVGAPVLIFFCCNATRVFRLLLGTKWEAAGAYASMLAIVAFITITISWLDRIFDATGKQHVALIWETIHTALTLASLYIGLRWLINPVFAVAVYVAIDLLCECVWVRLAYDAGGLDFSDLLKTIPLVAQSSLLTAGLMLASVLAGESYRLVLSAVFTGAVVGLMILREFTPKDQPLRLAS